MENDLSICSSVSSLLALSVLLQKDPVQRDLVYQCLTALLDFCSAKVPTLVPHLCTVMSNYDLVLNVASTRHVSCDFVTFAAAWLRYRKTTCNDVPWSSESLYKSPFDEALDHLREYSVIVNNKDLKDACLELQHAVNIALSLPAKSSV